MFSYHQDIHQSPYQHGFMPRVYHYVPYSWNNSALEFERHQFSPQQRLTFVLVHGSWADAHFWDGVAAELRSRGHIVYTPEYAGHGNDPNKNVTHAMITKSIVDFILECNLYDFVLVGHSFGGTIIQKVAEQVPKRIKRLVFWDAFVLKDGESVADAFPPQMRKGFEQLRANSKDDTIMLPFALFRDAFVNTATLEEAKQMYLNVTPEPAKPLFEKLNLKAFYTLPTPKSYVYFYQDNALPQGEGYGWHPNMSSRLGQFRLIVGDGDHFTDTLSRPYMLAQKIYEASRD
ncbi:MULTISPECIES: alpha/beta fold hydrolase [Lysinibacillus]|jgi:pimeloyl-ACP methyl ester carboxylesterase|uniref:alpha/beta fold hydrolase n=1 Tax=Lysinibacillus TaxID=400634 RepID=UPI0004D4876E|nr:MULTISPECIES: alpha/beta fold hydrolase [Lysinibacillus]AJK88069.1 salicylate esterase [Lysinibacillus fusiformis]KHK49251.1 salicylate esterase [Lysinibacillus sp. A1]MCE4042734.1 alpha/beta hydrolase [Lysinibacillus fusiformis]